MKKIIIAVILLTAIVVGGTGCMVLKRPSFKERALAYMEDKYSEEFTFVSNWGSGYANKGKQQILVQCKSVSGTILVEGSRNGTENDFRDNYLALKYSDQLTDTVKTITEEVFGQAWVHYEVLTQTLSADLPADATFRQYCEDPHASVTVSVAVPESCFDPTLMETYGQKIREAGIHGLIRFAVVPAGDFDNLQIARFNEILRLKTYGYYAVVLVNEDEISIKPREAGAK